MGKVWSGSMDGYLRKSLDICKKVVAKDWDMLFIIDGVEGAGKSVLAQHCAKYCDPTFNIDRVCLGPKEFVESINNANNFQSVIYDEAFNGLSSRGSMTGVNRMLISVLAEIRQKNLFVFVVLPSFFELDKYAAMHRSRALLHVYTDKEFGRGYFCFYNKKKKDALYIKGKKFYNYNSIKSNFYGRFSKGYVVDEQEYRQKKLKALKSYSEKKKEQTNPMIEKLKGSIATASHSLYETKNLKEIGDMFGLSYKSIGRYMAKYPKEMGLETDARTNKVYNF